MYFIARPEGELNGYLVKTESVDVLNNMSVRCVGISEEEFNLVAANLCSQIVLDQHNEVLPPESVPLTFDAFAAVMILFSSDRKGAYEYLIRMQRESDFETDLSAVEVAE